MADVWTKDRVLSLAPDAASAKAGQGQASPAKWPSLGQQESVLWGEVQGSGKHPYQVCIDLGGPAFKCSCPSRKFPCKHAIGLMILLAEQPDRLPLAEAPQWVADWIASRQQRVEKRESKRADEASKPVDAAAQVRRAKQRESKVSSGVEELQRFLGDVARQGLAAAQSQPSRHWESVAARMVDAQAPGLARMVRELGDVVNSGPGWQSRSLRRLGRLHLALSGYGRLDALPVESQLDLRTEIGWTQSREEVLAQEGEVGTWLVVGQRVEEEDRLTVQRTWLLRQQDGRFALILHFAAGNQPMDTSLLIGTQFNGELVYYPGATPLRAIVKSQPSQLAPLDGCPGSPTIDSALDSYALALAANPWLAHWPMALAGISLLQPRSDASADLVWSIKDTQGASLPLKMRANDGWILAAVSGGEPVSLIGEWDGEQLAPLGVAANGVYCAWRGTYPQARLARVT